MIRGTHRPGAFALLLVLPLVCFGQTNESVVTQTVVSADAVLNYNLDATILSFGSAAGNLLSETISDIEFSRLTGIDPINGWMEAETGYFNTEWYDAVVAGGFDDSPYVNTAPDIASSSVTNSVSSFVDLSGQTWYLDMYDGHDITENVRHRVWGQGEDLGVVVDEVRSLRESLDAPTDVAISQLPSTWTATRPTPNLYWFNLSESLVNGVSYSGASLSLASFSDAANKVGPFYDTSQTMLDSSLDYISGEYSSAGEPPLRPIFAGVSLAVFWVIAIKWFLVHGHLLVEGVVSLLTGKQATSVDANGQQKWDFEE